MNSTMMRRWTGRQMVFSLVLGLSLLFGASRSTAQITERLRLQNDWIEAEIDITRGKLEQEILRAQPRLRNEDDTAPVELRLDGDFAIELMWTGWRAPGKVHNADNAIQIRAKDFIVRKVKNKTTRDGSGRILLEGAMLHGALEVRIEYRLGKNDFFLRRRLWIRDPRRRRHFLRHLWPRYGKILSPAAIVKAGGFGNPIALSLDHGGAFGGVEYPAAQNRLTATNGRLRLQCGHEVGAVLDTSWVKSEWVVVGLSPNRNVKSWFLRYVDRIRVAPLRPFLLYNTWYDVRAPEYTDRPQDVMNEENLLRIIEDFRRNMFVKRSLHLDAFVLDDGWDVYRSDWRLREKEFPHGLAPIRKKLWEMGTGLGIWLGPIGGYSHRDWRVGWMREHGYETVGDEMCVAGSNYRSLLRQRVVDFVAQDSVIYFKWDGIQFSCSEPDHGHPVGIYSRRAIMQSVIELCRAVREKNPKVFLNITSGTWLSPWWLKYANQIWMQGRDYGYAAVPSISRRDAAMTYRDVVLYQDLRHHDFWFPIANLMTHGIIKGHLQKLGGEAEPLRKFTDNAVLYFARGVSMWELYISPDLLSEGEWNALAKSIQWARDRFDIMKSTEMIGGDPGRGEAYGFAHFHGKRGILALRNPSIHPARLKVRLATEMGLDPDAATLVLERVYPDRWISPNMYAADASLSITLGGYETAVYEIYPLENARRPLVADARFSMVESSDNQCVLTLYDAGEKVRLLNAEFVEKIQTDGRELSLADLRKALRGPVPKAAQVKEVQSKKSGAAFHWRARVQAPAAAKTAALAFLLNSAENSDAGALPELILKIDGKITTAGVAEKQKNLWVWYRVDIENGSHLIELTLKPAGALQEWDGEFEGWMVYESESAPIAMKFACRQAVDEPAMPPRAIPAGSIPGQQLLLHERIHLAK